MAAHELSRKLENLQRSDSPPQVRSAQDGLVVERVFSTAGKSPFEQVKWEKRSACIKDESGNTIFEQGDVDVPESWSQLATNVVVSKYFYGEGGTTEREGSIRDLVHRVARTIADWGREDGLFASDDDAESFYNELAYLCLNQYGAFNSPVWFNVGLFHHRGVSGSEGNFHWDAEKNQPVRTLRSYEYPQASACFIQSVQDNMEDIMRLARQEAMLFKYGSGTGTDLSTLRSSREKLSGGGTPSGPLSFMRVYDQIAAVIKSGGKTRRAAKMQSLRCDHPDIRDFIECKMREERKAWSLIEQGYDGSFNGEAYASVMFQNSNLSVRVTDEFMQAALDDDDWQTFAVTTGEPIRKFRARELMDLIAEGTYVCGDPGLQYHTTVNRWHTCPESGEICASNPCSEYMFLNDSACNLASLNLLKFRRPDGSFDVQRFRSAVRIFIIAQEILVDHASYPSEKICRNSHDYRPLGLGYANLGALCMSLGLPYDSDAGRAFAGAITAILTGSAYAAGSELASRLGAFGQFHRNRSSMLRVIRRHRDAVESVSSEHCPLELLSAARQSWEEALAAGEQFGYRNAQVTVLAPTGTIGFMMDCDTTGIEPEIALVKYKNLAGGGMFKIVNQTVRMALERLGYSRSEADEIVDHLHEHETIEGAPHLRKEHLPVFDCAFRSAGGQRSIHYMGHIRMMAAAQPFISGAISKTVNMPRETTAEEIRNVYVESWKLGLKAVAIYRDGSKRTQPVNVRKSREKTAAQDEQADAISLEQLEAARRAPHRERLPATRPSMTHKFDVAGHEGYLNVGLYEEDGSPGELFVTMAKEGSTVGGMMDAFATAISLCLQYGVPLEALVGKFSHQRFEPSGMTSNRDIPFAKSIVDYIFRWLGITFLDDYRSKNVPRRPEKTTPSDITKAAPEAVTDDDSSETSTERAPGKDVSGPAGTRFENRYEAGGNGDEVKAAVKLSAAELQSRSLGLAAERMIPHMQYARLMQDAPACACGAIMVRNGSCYKCMNCGSTSGCS